MSRVAIIGAGNLGAYLGTQLKAAGHDVFFCVRRTPASALRFEETPVWRFPFFFRHPPAADIVLMTVKTHDTPGALGWLTQLCKNNQPVAVIQNGVGHSDRIAPYNAIPVLSYVYVEAKDGIYRAFLPQHAHFTIPSQSSCNPFADLFVNTTIQIEREGAFHTAAWRKKNIWNWRSLFWRKRFPSRRPTALAFVPPKGTKFSRCSVLIQKAPAPQCCRISNAANAWSWTL